VTTARAHNAQGADELLLIDIDATREGRGPAVGLIEAVAAECYMPLTVGGGIRSVNDAHRCVDAGADKLCINAGALGRPGVIDDLARVFGAQAIVLSVDFSISEGREVVMDFRTGRPHERGDVLPWIVEAIERGAGEIRLMAFDREGDRSGFPIEFLGRVSSEIKTPLLVEGGIGSFRQIADAYEAGADGVCLGTILVFEDNNLVKVKRALRSLGQDMRI